MNTGGGGSLRAAANVSSASANMPLAAIGFMVVLSGVGSVLFAVRRRPRAGQHAAGRLGR